MFNHYEGWSESDLLTLRTRLQRQGATGQVISSGIAGVNVQKASTGSGTSQILILKRVQYALWLLGEVQVADENSQITVNPYQNPYTSTVKRTRTSYI